MAVDLASKQNKLRVIVGRSAKRHASDPLNAASTGVPGKAPAYPAAQERADKYRSVPPSGVQKVGGVAKGLGQSVNREQKAPVNVSFGNIYKERSYINGKGLKKNQ